MPGMTVHDGRNAQPALSELPLRDALIARELARHHSDGEGGDSLDDAMCCLSGSGKLVFRFERGKLVASKP